MVNNSARFEGKVAVLSASSNGIGLAIARRLGKEKAKIVVSSRKMENITKAVDVLRNEGIDVIGVKCHVTSKEEREKLIQETIKHYGGIDIFVSCAGVNPHYGPITNCSESAFDKIFEVNVKSSFLFTNEIYPFMKKRGGGSILFLSSNIAYVNTDLISVYASSKICLSVLAKGYANNMAQDNIRVNCLAAGGVDTPFFSKIKNSSYDYSKFLKDVPFKRMGTTEEIAASAAFLLSDDASYITGETLVVGGGLQSRI